jgi:hypothetical protein
MNFAGTAARGSAIGSAVSQGMVSYLDDSNGVEVYRTTGTAVAGWERIDAPQSPNFIINGAFEINQRGFTSVTDNSFGFDRWRQFTLGGTSTYSSQTFTLGSAPVAGYESRNFARIVTASQSASSHYTQFAHKIESVRTLANSPVTVSFWARAGSGTPKIAVEWVQSFGTGGSPSANVNIYAGQVTLSTSWARYSLTFLSPTIAGKTIGTANDDNIQLNIYPSAGSDFNARTGSLGIQNGTFDFWGVQVEAGQTATPFRRNANSIAGELAACQRYYYRATAENTFGWFGIMTGNFLIIQFPVNMRAIPASLDWSGTASAFNNAQGGTITNITLNADGGSSRIGAVSVTGTSLISPSVIRANNSATAFIGFSAEL